MNIKHLVLFSAIFSTSQASTQQANKLVLAAGLADEEALKVASNHTGKDILAALKGPSEMSTSKKTKDRCNVPIQVQMTGLIEQQFNLSTDIVSNIFGKEGLNAHLIRFEHPVLNKKCNIYDLGASAKSFSSLARIQSLFGGDLKNHADCILKGYKNEGDDLDQKYDIYFKGFNIFKKPIIRNEFFRKIKEVVQKYTVYDEVIAARKYDAKLAPSYAIAESAIKELKPSASEEPAPTSEDSISGATVEESVKERLFDEAVDGILSVDGAIAFEIAKYLAETTKFRTPIYKQLFQKNQIAVILVIPRENLNPNTESQASKAEN